MKIPECLKKLSPNWAKQFEESKSVDEVSKEFETDERYFDIGDVRCCVVGEANLFSDEYFRNLVGTSNEYQWSGTPATCCIMARKRGEEVNIIKLNKFRKDGTVTDSEYDAIRSFDWSMAKAKDLKILRRLAKRLGVQIVIGEKPQ